MSNISLPLVSSGSALCVTLMGLAFMQQFNRTLKYGMSAYALSTGDTSAAANIMTEGMPVKLSSNSRNYIAIPKGSTSAMLSQRTSIIIASIIWILITVAMLLFVYYQRTKIAKIKEKWKTTEATFINIETRTYMENRKMVRKTYANYNYKVNNVEYKTSGIANAINQRKVFNIYYNPENPQEHLLTIPIINYTSIIMVEICISVIAFFIIRNCYYNGQCLTVIY